MVMEWQKDPQRFEELMEAPFQEFRALIAYSEDDIWGAFQTAQKIVKEKKSAGKSQSANANGNVSEKGPKKDEKEKNKAPKSNSESPYCANCRNDPKLLAEYNKEPHSTRTCPFPQSQKTREYLANKVKQKVDISKFPQFASNANDKPATPVVSNEDNGQYPQTK